MKSIVHRFSILMMAILVVSLSACGPATSSSSVEIELKLTGEMLFEGSNSLQFAKEGQLTDLAAAVGTESSSIKNVRVSSAHLELDTLYRRITESLLLQIVSDHQELITIGTLSPLTEDEPLVLSLAENPSILPYLQDSGTTWVLDLNITEDYMDEMVVNGKLTLNVEYVSNEK